ncbi:MAG: hypothetical protein ACPGSH_05700, partial [Ilumatobacteraceae bacterium]
SSRFGSQHSKQLALFIELDIELWGSGEVMRRRVGEGPGDELVHFGRGDVGIGQLLRRYANQLMGEELLAAVILSSALGVTVFMTFGWLQTIAIGKWHETSGGGA